MQSVSCSLSKPEVITDYHLIVSSKTLIAPQHLMRGHALLLAAPSTPLFFSHTFELCLLVHFDMKKTPAAIAPKNCQERVRLSSYNLKESIVVQDKEVPCYNSSWPGAPKLSHA